METDTKKDVEVLTEDTISKLQRTQEQTAEEGRYLRQLSWFNPVDLQTPVWIVGAGGIGSWTALALAKLGLKQITVVDFDKVDEHNQPNQLYGPGDVGKLKVEQLGEIIGDLTGTGINIVGTRLADPMEMRPTVKGILVAGVDSMASRRIVWGIARENPAVPLYLDGRIGGQAVKLYSVTPLTEVDRYERTLHSDEEAAPLPCTAQAVIDVAFFMAGMLTRAVRTFLKDGARTFEQICDVSNFEIMEET